MTSMMTRLQLVRCQHGAGPGPCQVCDQAEPVTALPTPHACPVWCARNHAADVEVEQDPHVRLHDRTLTTITAVGEVTVTITRFDDLATGERGKVEIEADHPDGMSPADALFAADLMRKAVGMAIREPWWRG